MGIGYFAVGNNRYDGNAKVKDEKIENGTFLTRSFEDGEFVVTVGNEYMLCQEDTYVDELGVASKDMFAKQGEYAKMKAPLPGEHFVTDQAEAAFEIGAEVSVGANGKLVAGAEGKHAAVVVDKFTVADKVCYRCAVKVG